MKTITGSGVYAIHNTINQKAYVGSTLNFAHRFKDHQGMLKKQRHPNKYLSSAWSKYGADVFEFRILEAVSDPSQLLDREQHWMEQYQAGAGCYNVAPTARRTGYRASEETKQKIRAAQIGRPVRILSESTKQKIGAANRGKKHSPEIVKANSERAKARGASKAFLEGGARSKIKTYTVPLLAPDGTRYETITNLRTFCQKHELQESSMRRIIVDRTLNNHKGWRRADEEPITREEAISRAVKKRLANPAERDRVSRTAKAAMDDPDFKARCTAALRTPETIERARLSRLRITYRFIDPDGAEHVVTDLRTFCREHGLNEGSMRLLFRGKSKMKSCKGWKSAAVSLP